MNQQHGVGNAAGKLADFDEFAGANRASLAQIINRGMRSQFQHIRSV